LELRDLSLTAIATFRVVPEPTCSTPSFPSIAPSLSTFSLCTVFSLLLPFSSLRRGVMHTDRADANNATLCALSQSPGTLAIDVLDPPPSLRTCSRALSAREAHKRKREKRTAKRSDPRTSRARREPERSGSEGPTRQGRGGGQGRARGRRLRRTSGVLFPRGPCRCGAFVVELL